MPFGRHSFFGLWLGYILTIDAIVLHRRGESPLTQNSIAFTVMFIVSAPLWWVFEGINQLTNNWHYVGVSHYSTLKYALLATWNFSIVVPAVFETARLLSTFKLIRRCHHGLKIPFTRGLLIVISVLGTMMIPVIALWPSYVYPLAWLSLFLILDPINFLMDRSSIARNLQNGDWRNVITFALGALICGWFWEMWNFQALPKWEYSIPYLEFGRIFEMPVLGYLGYLPFGLEVYVGYHFIVGFFHWHGENLIIGETFVDETIPIT